MHTPPSLSLTDVERLAVLGALCRPNVTGLRAAFTPCPGLRVVEDFWGEVSRDELIAIHRNVEHAVLFDQPDDESLGRLIRESITRYALSCGDLDKAAEHLRAAADDAREELRNCAGLDGTASSRLAESLPEMPAFPSARSAA